MQSIHQEHHACRLLETDNYVIVFTHHNNNIIAHFLSSWSSWSIRSRGPPETFWSLRPGVPNISLLAPLPLRSDGAQLTFLTLLTRVAVVTIVTRSSLVTLTTL